MVCMHPQKIPPGPKGLPFIGEAFRFQKDPFGFFLWLRENFGDIVQDKNSAFPIVTVFSPEAIEHVLVRSAKKYQKDRILKSWALLFGEGLLTAEGDHWKRDRRAIQPAFARVRLEDYRSIMVGQAKKTVERLKLKQGQSLDVSVEMTELTLHIALESLFGSEVDQKFTHADYELVAQALKHITEWFEFSSGAWMVLPMAFPWFPFPAKLRYQRAVEQLDQLMSRIISEKRESLKKGAPSNDLLAALLSAADPEGGQQPIFTDRQVRDHALTFFLAGHETTSLALTYILRLLALHSDVQEKLRSSMTQANSLEDCDYLDQVIDEALRLFPPASTTAREAIEADELVGYPIARGTTVGIPIWAIHRDPRYFGEAVDQFRPERWTPEFRKRLPRSVYLPFGYGPRMCIGFGFAIQEMKLILNEVLKNYRVEIRPDDSAIRLLHSITMRPRDPVMLSFHPISRRGES